jgi:hypothetical protein
LGLYGRDVTWVERRGKDDRGKKEENIGMKGQKSIMRLVEDPPVSIIGCHS